MIYPESPEHDFNYFEDALLQQNLNFTATYMTLKNLVTLIDTAPRVVSTRTIDALVCILESEQHTSQKMSFFLFREASEALMKIVAFRHNSYKVDVMSILLKLMNSSCKAKHRAIAESIGAVPPLIRTPALSFKELKTPYPEIHWNDLAEKTGISNAKTYHWYGRSVAIKTDFEKIAVFKFLKRGDDLKSLQSESNWIEHLCGGSIQFSKRFEIPHPVKIAESSLFMIRHFPIEIPEEAQLAPCHTAICFTITNEYFSYPNDTENKLGKNDLAEILSRNASLLGQLASNGIIHTAPIPLFHNRIQQNRRDDGGLYLWSKGGRLDQWLQSCKYPNFGKSGLRDFEHFEICHESDKTLYQHIGSHILSLILVAGSYFRISEKQNKSKQNDKPDTLPNDIRHLFDKHFFSFLIQIIYKGYYKGFTGLDRCEKIPVNTFELAERLIAVMGIDNHMDEVLRTVDQKSMSDDEFQKFLIKRGLDLQLISKYRKGQKNIILSTGPHLGGFNRKISVPELIQFLETISAYCIADRYLSKITMTPEC